MSKKPLIYNPKVLELFRNPKNAGKMEDATIYATVGSPICGDVIVMYLKINEEKGVIEKATFESYGCVANIASASMTTEMAKGKKLEEAWKLSWKDVADKLGGLPPIKYHCSMLAVGALKRAIRAYYEKIGRNPSWLSGKLTVEEKHALEVEELAKSLAEKIKGTSNEQGERD